MADLRRVLGRHLVSLAAEAGGVSAEVRSGIGEAMEGAPDRVDAVVRRALRVETVAAAEASVGWKVACFLSSCWLEKVAQEESLVREAFGRRIEVLGHRVIGQREFERILHEAREDVAMEPQAAASKGKPGDREAGAVHRLLERADDVLRAVGSPLRAGLYLPQPADPPGAGSPSKPPTLLAGTFWGRLPFPPSGRPGPAPSDAGIPAILAAFQRMKAIIETILPTLHPLLARHLLVPA